jgi:hypothetical protein
MIPPEFFRPPLPVTPRLLENGIATFKKNQTECEGMWPGISRTNYLPMYFDDKEIIPEPTATLCMEFIPLNFEPSEGRVETRWNFYHHPNAVRILIEFGIDPKDNHPYLLKPHVYAWKYIEGKIYRLKYIRETQNAETVDIPQTTCALETIERATCPDPTPADYITLVDRENDEMRQRLERRGIPVRIDWEQTVVRFFTDPMREFTRSASQPFSLARNSK